MELTLTGADTRLWRTGWVGSNSWGDAMALGKQTPLLDGCPDSCKPASSS